jgi:DNA-binding LacI/PurR family transcriptional regulator
VLGLAEWPQDYWQWFARDVASRGMSTKEYWVQALARSAHRSAANLTHLLMHKGQQDRPDGLLIMDDNLLEHGTQGLLAAGVRVPDELDVVAHTNFPWPTPSAVPVRRLGFDVRRILAVSLDRIDQQRRNEQAPHMTTVRAAFEDEPPEIVS